MSCYQDCLAQYDAKAAAARATYDAQHAACNGEPVCEQSALNSYVQRLEDALEELRACIHDCDQQGQSQQ